MPATTFAPVEEQLDQILRGTEQIVVEDELKAQLQESVDTGRPLRVKLGIDPTAIDVHLGHTVALRKLRQFQDLGHTAVIIIGNYTALVGDPSGKDKTRPRMTPEQVEKNAESYLEQIGKVIDLSKAEIRPNGDWFAKMSFLEVLELTSKITVARMLERDDFSKRFADGTAISLHECLYPLMQGWDSVEIEADVELGGTEQLFNLMVGRRLQEDAGQNAQMCVTMPILVGTDGERRMGKSLGNYIGLSDPAREMFGKVMSIPDNVMRNYFVLLTHREMAEIDRLVSSETHPRLAKEILGKDIVGQYYGADAADAAAEDFKRQFSQHQLPEDMPEKTIAVADLDDGKMWIAKLLVSCGLGGSNRQARQLVQQKAVKLGEEQIPFTDDQGQVEVVDGLIIRCGRKFVRVRVRVVD